jgi:hypothetical protein
MTTRSCPHYQQRPHAVCARAPGADGRPITVLEVIITFCDHRGSKFTEQDAEDLIGARLSCQEDPQACEIDGVV